MPPCPFRQYGGSPRLLASGEGKRRIPCPEPISRAPTGKATDESTCTPDFVRGDLAIAGGGHPSRPGVADRLLRPTRRLGRAALERLRSRNQVATFLALLRVGFA